MIEIEMEHPHWIHADGYRKQILADSKTLSAEGVLAQVVVIEAGHKVKAHFHKQTTEFYYVIEGNAALTINYKTRRLKRGDMLLIEPNDLHAIDNDRTDLFKVLVLKTNQASDDIHWIGEI